MSGQVQPQIKDVRDGEAHGAGSSPELMLKLSDLVSLEQNDLGEYYLEPNTKLLKELEDRGVDNSFLKDKQEFSVFDGEAGLYITLVNVRDDVVLLEYHDSFMSMYKLARWGDVRDMPIVECHEDSSCGVITPEKSEFDIVRE